MDKLTVIIVDDHTLVRAGLKELLLTMGDVEVVAEAGDGLEAIEKVRQHRPDLVLLDIAMPKMRGLEAIREIRRESPESKILILSMYNNPEYVRESLKNGAHGYLLKEAAADELRLALNSVRTDNIYISPSLSQVIVSEWIQNKTGDGVLSTGNSILTERERAVLKLLAEGHTNKQVAELLHISVKTVETHRSRIMEKLDLANFAALVKYAIKVKIIEMG